MEQRISALEEELKVLKSQIKAVLLDIKEYLTAGNYVAQASPDSGVQTVQPIEEDQVGIRESSAGQTRERLLDEFPVSSLTETEQRAISRMSQDRARSAALDGGTQIIDLLTLSVVTQWLSRAMPLVGKDQVSKIIEIYDITANLPSRLKEAMQLLAELCYDESSEPAGNGRGTAALTIQLLIELDSLLRYRSGALESVVLSLLLDKPGSKKDSHG